MNFQTLRQSDELFNLLGKSKCSFISSPTTPFRSFGGGGRIRSQGALCTFAETTFRCADPSLLKEVDEEESDYQVNDEAQSDLQIAKHATSSFGKLEEMKGAPSPDKLTPTTHVLMSGVLKKKGLIFWNKRYVTLDSAGIVQYFDVKKQDSAARATIDLTNPLTHILHRTTGSQTLKLVTPQE